jgi:hypothetical protein
MSNSALKQQHALAFDGDANVLTLKNPVKHAEAVSTVDIKFKALQLRGVQGLICDKEQVPGSLCIRLVNNRLSVTVFGNHVTSKDPVISGSTQTFAYNFKPFTGYSISVVYGLLAQGMAYSKLYVDGHPVGTKFFASGRPARLGTCFVGGLQSNAQGYFQGFLDELRLWNIPRMPWQIHKDFDRQLVGVEHGLIAYFPFNNPKISEPSLGISQWHLTVSGAMYTDPFTLGRRDKVV